jgi:MoaA/NifB/PqqE/SkfB family radical SAM enzyme
MIFCHAPWTNIDINQQGTIAPCCKFRHVHYNESEYNIFDHSVEQYIESDTLTSVKEDFKQGNWPIGCIRCKTEEENRIPSKRQMDYKRWQSVLDSRDLIKKEFITSSIAFGNTCNLKCITCSSWASSRWHKEYKDLTGMDIKPVHFRKNKFVEEFVKWAPDMLHIDIPGGEPFLSGVPAQHQLLDYYITTGKAQHMTLHYTTNVTIWPNDEWWTRWQHFKNVEIQLSLDGIDQQFEYIRHPANWNTVLQHIKQYQTKQIKYINVELSVAHTVSAYNVYYLDKFYAWCESVGLPKPWCGRVHDPNEMRPTVWHGKAKQAIIKRLYKSKFIDVRKWAQLMLENDDSEHYDAFVKRTAWHDQYRGTNFSKIFPEMSEYLLTHAS